MLPPHHVELLQNLVTYHRTPEALYVHGGLDPSIGSVERQDRESIIWGTGSFPGEYRGNEMIVYGHCGNAVLDDQGWPRPNRRTNSIGIDSIGTGVLTALRLPDHRVFRSRMWR